MKAKFLLFIAIVQLCLMTQSIIVNVAWLSALQGISGTIFLATFFSLNDKEE